MAEEEKKKRKLTAICSADVKGYSRLMEDDEEVRTEAAEGLRLNPKIPFIKW